MRTQEIAFDKSGRERQECSDLLVHRGTVASELDLVIQASQRVYEREDCKAAVPFGDFECVFGQVRRDSFTCQYFGNFVVFAAQLRGHGVANHFDKPVPSRVALLNKVFDNSTNSMRKQNMSCSPQYNPVPPVTASCGGQKSVANS